MANNAASYFYSPLRYPGGKNCIFPFVSKLFYENNLLGIQYAEPFAGGAGLALRLLVEGYVSHIHINDLDRSIYSFWHSILNRNADFIKWMNGVEVTMENWRHYKHIHTNADSADQFELAQATFFLNRTNVSGVLKGGVIGGHSQNGKYKIDARFNKADLEKRISRISELRNRISLTNLDGINFVQELTQSQKDKVFIYLDPPYYQKGADLYMNFFQNEDHKKLAKYVHKIKQPWMVSYDNHDFILSLYPRQKKLTYKLSQSASNRVGDEILVFSKQVHFDNSLTALNSAIPL